MKKIGEVSIIDKDKKVIEVAAMHMKKYFPVESVILFGSKAKGKDDDESDIDLLLLTKRPISWKERKAIIDTLFTFELEYDVIISPFILTKTEWTKGPLSILPIHDEILTAGIVL